MSKKIGARFSLMVRPKDGVTYVIRTDAERAEVPAGASSSTFSSNYRFYKRTGEQEAEALFYAVIFVRAANGTRRRAIYVSSKVRSIEGLDITVNASDAAIEVFVYDSLPTTQAAFLTDYTAKKEIPVEKVPGTLRCRWTVGGVEQTTLSAKSDGTPRGDFPTHAAMVASLMVRSASGTEAVLTDTGSLTIYLTGTSTSFLQTFSSAAMTYSLQVSGSSLSVLTQCTGLRAVWTTSKFGTVEFMLPKVFDGARGYSGPVPIPAGIWTNTETYTATTSQAQYVWNEHDSNFYIVKAPETGTNTATVGTRPDQNLTQWTRINNMEPLFTDLAIIKGGTVGKSVFWDEFMYSQYGRNRILDGSGNITGYETVDEDGGSYGAPVQASGANGVFEPNFLINFLTGKVQMKDAEVKGVVEAVSGFFGDLEIGANNKFDSKTGKLHFGLNTNSYTYISTSQTELARNANIYVLNAAGGTGIYATSTTTAPAITAVGGITSTGPLTASGGAVNVSYGDNKIRMDGYAAHIEGYDNNVISASLEVLKNVIDLSAINASLRVFNGGISIVCGDFGIRITAANGIQKTNDGGSTWNYF
ncbi:MAG: hypothetical protein IKO85_00730 [Bacteroidaceae bacterium]|nr:hypothetical protein [Bacteroidaceae bacterium]